MTTPRGAVPRDLEQRLRDLEGQVRTLTGALLHRKQMNVSQGDFVVSGGGNVVVQDGGDVAVESSGNVYAKYPTGAPAARFGPYVDSSGNVAYGVQLTDENGKNLFGAMRYLDQPAHPGGQSVAAFENLDGGFTAVGGEVRLFRSDFAAYLQINAVDGATIEGGAQGVHLTGTGGVWVPNVGTSSNAANARIGPSGQLVLSTSSRRYKQDIEPADIDPDQVLELQPVRFRDRSEVAEQGDDAPEHVGFIAEDAADLGLEPWVDRTEDGTVNAFEYASWCVALHAVCQRQQQELTELRGRLERLEARLPAAAGE